jgi:protocatechuate 3,4-dioxygenase beta subunit
LTTRPTIDHETDKEPMTDQSTEPRIIYDPVVDTPTHYLREGAAAHPPLDYPPYKSTTLRHPRQPLVYLPHTITEITGPALGGLLVTGAQDADLLAQHEGEPIGERISVSGRVFDTEGKPLRDTLVEIWQANAAGRYLHRWDRWPAPLDPNFSGAGRCVTDDHGRYSFLTIKPGPYPWGNHYNAWRPAHIHFSLLGRAFTQRLVTQMYFPGDPFFPYDPIFNSVADEAARRRMISRFSIHRTVPNWSAAYEFDIYLRGPSATPIEESQ